MKTQTNKVRQRKTLTLDKISSLKKLFIGERNQVTDVKYLSRLEDGWGNEQPPFYEIRLPVALPQQSKRAAKKSLIRPPQLDPEKLGFELKNEAQQKLQTKGQLEALKILQNRLAEIKPVIVVGIDELLFQCKDQESINKIFNIDPQQTLKYTWYFVTEKTLPKTTSIITKTEKNFNYYHFCKTDFPVKKNNSSAYSDNSLPYCENFNYHKFYVNLCDLQKLNCKNFIQTIANILSNIKNMDELNKVNEIIVDALNFYDQIHHNKNKIIEKLKQMPFNIKTVEDLEKFRKEKLIFIEDTVNFINIYQETKNKEKSKKIIEADIKFMEGKLLNCDDISNFLQTKTRLLYLISNSLSLSEDTFSIPNSSINILKRLGGFQKKSSEKTPPKIIEKMKMNTHSKPVLQPLLKEKHETYEQAIARKI